MTNIIAQNKKAGYEYILLDRFEAGIELKGAEVKSLRNKKASLSESFARVEGGAVYLYGAHISSYKQSGPFAPDPIRVRKLLLHKNEIEKLKNLTTQKGYTLMPTKLYFKRGFVKVEIALAKGKKIFDKREKLHQRTVDIEIKRSLKLRGK